LKAEGWYVDPYGRHDARWFSDGDPTALVRDDGVESRDPPPDVPYPGQLEPIFGAEGSDSTGADDLRRADSDEAPYDPAVEVDAAWDSFGESTGGD